LAVLSLLSDVADEQPLICVVDDQESLDRVSAQTLAFVRRRLDAESVGLVFVVRTPSGDPSRASSVNSSTGALEPTSVEVDLDNEQVELRDDLQDAAHPRRRVVPTLAGHATRVAVAVHDREHGRDASGHGLDARDHPGVGEVPSISPDGLHQPRCLREGRDCRLPGPRPALDPLVAARASER
jgi:hypothetical protein